MQMKVGVFEFTMVLAFLIMLTVKVLDVGIGASLSWLVVLAPLYGPILLMLVSIGLCLAVAGVWTGIAAAIAFFKKKP